MEYVLAVILGFFVIFFFIEILLYLMYCIMIIVCGFLPTVLFIAIFQITFTPLVIAFLSTVVFGGAAVLFVVFWTTGIGLGGR